MNFAQFIPLFSYCLSLSHSSIASLATYILPPIFRYERFLVTSSLIFFLDIGRYSLAISSMLRYALFVVTIVQVLSFYLNNVLFVIFDKKVRNCIIM